jgi:hypothetical protein
VPLRFRRRTLALIGTVALFLVPACRADLLAGAASVSNTPASAESAEGSLSLAWASTTYAIREPPGAAVELRVVVDNRSSSATESTSVRWDPSFARAFDVLQSDPPPWRVRIAENGWGSLDTSGVIPHQYGEIRVWFIARPGVDPATVDLAPQVEVMANGTIRIGSAVATPLHFAERRVRAEQQRFEQGPLALLADAVTFVPASASSAYLTGVALTTLLGLIVLAGLAGAVMAATGQPVLPAPAVRAPRIEAPQRVK